MTLTGTFAPTATWEQYCDDAATAGAFENRVLYSMCRANPRHADAYITAGKVTAIGRIYAASPERGAGAGRSGALADAIAKRLADSDLDSRLDAIDFSQPFSRLLLDHVTKTHDFLVQEIADATRGWSLASEDERWEPRRQSSFASKYLHFHRPNAFPIMDKFARAGLLCAGGRGSFEAYADFCEAILRYVDDRPHWTLRSVDTGLVARGRVHSTRTSDYCLQCGRKFVKRPRTKN